MLNIVAKEVGSEGDGRFSGPFGVCGKAIAVGIC